MSSGCDSFFASLFIFLPRPTRLHSIFATRARWLEWREPRDSSCRRVRALQTWQYFVASVRTRKKKTSNHLPENGVHIFYSFSFPSSSQANSLKDTFLATVISLLQGQSFVARFIRIYSTIHADDVYIYDLSFLFHPDEEALRGRRELAGKQSRIDEKPGRRGHRVNQRRDKNKMMMIAGEERRTENFSEHERKTNSNRRRVIRESVYSESSWGLWRRQREDGIRQRACARHFFGAVARHRKRHRDQEECSFVTRLARASARRHPRAVNGFENI